MEETKTPIVEQCKGCLYVREDQLCRVYYWPERKWGDARKCQMCSTTVREVVEEKKVIDPIKKSKRSMKGEQ